MKGTLFDIQHFAVHDGPGIRTLVFLKGCPLRCEWCCNPESQTSARQVRYISFRCRGCHTCAKICPKNAITELEGSVNIDFAQCRNCTDKPCLDACCREALNLTGYEMDSAELLGIIEKDKAFYRNSGGGVTFTGGEPVSQPAFLLEMLKLCKESGIHTAIETCGYARTEEFERILPFTDLFLFDLKLIDPLEHLKHTGQPNDLILKNLSYLSHQSHQSQQPQQPQPKSQIIVRFPVIPGITDTQHNLNGIIDLMKELGLTEIHLEPYHTLGLAKYEEFGIPQNSAQIPDVKLSEIETFATLFRKSGLTPLCP
jgi:pyruvate formate lyase activating enzyme